MPLWRDPFDDLIDDLERAVPAGAAPVIDRVPPFEDEQLRISAILWGGAEELARIERDPRVQAVLAYYERLATRLKARDDASRSKVDGASR